MCCTHSTRGTSVEIIVSKLTVSIVRPPSIYKPTATLCINSGTSSQTIASIETALRQCLSGGDHSKSVPPPPHLRSINHQVYINYRRLTNINPALVHSLWEVCDCQRQRGLLWLTNVSEVSNEVVRVSAALMVSLLDQAIGVANHKWPVFSVWDLSDPVFHVDRDHTKSTTRKRTCARVFFESRQVE